MSTSFANRSDRGPRRRNLITLKLLVTAAVATITADAAGEASGGTYARGAAGIPPSQAEVIRSSGDLPALREALFPAEKSMSFALRRHVVSVRADSRHPYTRGDIIRFLGRGLPEGETLGRYRALANDLLNALGPQVTQFPEGFAESLAAVSRAPATDPVVADYLVQHLLTWTDLPLDFRYGLAMEVSASPENSTAGTALLGLRRMAVAEDLPASRREQIQARAGFLVAEDNAHEAARITAIQVLSLLDPQAASLPARKLAASADTPVSVRMAAVSALGRSGDSADRDFLQIIATGDGPPRLKTAAQSALSSR